MASRAMTEAELRDSVKRALERLKKMGVIESEPLPKAPSELGPPTPGAREALGVGYQLAKSKLKKVAKARQAYG